MKTYRVRYFVLCNHHKFGHTREANYVDVQADTPDDALAKAQLHCDRSYERVRKEDFKVTVDARYRHGGVAYPIEDDFKVESSW